MKYFLWLIKPFTGNDWAASTLGILLRILSLIIVGVLLWLFVWLIDSSFVPIKEKDGVCTNKYIVPAHTTTTLMGGKIMIPVRTYHNTTYNLEITIDELEDDVVVSKKHYRNISVGQKVHCKYTNGRLKNSLYIKSLE